MRHLSAWVDDYAGELLRKLQLSSLTDEASVNEFYKNVIEGLEIEGSYLILMMHDAWSVPYKNSVEHEERPDFDGTVFNYIIAPLP